MRVGALAGIGHTPLIRLSNLPGPDDAEVWVKLEAANPTGSLQGPDGAGDDRGGRAAGALTPGQTVVEYTGGSTGSSLAFVCSVKGYPLRIVTSNAFADGEATNHGGVRRDLEIIDSPDGITPS